MVRKISMLTLLIAISLSLQGAQAQQSRQEEGKAVSMILDGLHDAASRAEFDRYFGYYASDAVFLGTDATEHWTKEEFQDYAKPVFDRGQGWTYKMTSRHIYFSPDKNTAWFDELLMNQTLGECRGSGVLVRIKGEWKVSQYNLTIPIPNPLARKVAEMIRALNE